ncbi:DNA repair protein xp-c / rad4 [Anopheles darlingi]|uniref:DNA repair protein xp-c / rad4 n=1 Tax=Anopheles darlingi TaxID=43151 RepID=W5J7K4_ANODA|nr:DNA repair protein xp-c / rad4 [Anopheles darlingi]
MDSEENIYDEVEQEDSSAADFSASEDEWTPEKTKEPAKKPAETKRAKGKPSALAKKPVIPTGPVRVSRRIAAKKGVELPENIFEHAAPPTIEIANESSDDETDEEEKKETKRKTKRKGNAKRAPAKRQMQKCSTEDEPIKLTTFTVEQLYRKYRPDLSHPAVAPAQPSTSKAASKVAKQQKAKDGDEDSESSGDDYLVNPSELDLSSDFFRPTKQEREQRQAVDLFFDCNAGVELTDSEDEGSDCVPSGSKRTMGTTEPKPVKDTDVELGMKLLQQVNQSTEALAQIKRLKETQTNASASTSAKKHAASDISNGKMDSKMEGSQREDIASILHAGEKLAKHCGKSLIGGIGGRSDFVAVPSLERTTKPKDIEITLKPTVTTDAKGKKRTFDVLSALKRFMNREKRNSQIHLHKLSLLCWIGHGTYVNNELRKPSLIRFAQKKLLPGALNHATRPNGLTNLRYFQELTRYYRRTVMLKDDTMFYRQRRHPTLGKFLIFAIAKRAAYCKRDYILLFVLMLRSLGVYCRLVISPPVPPKTVAPGQLYKMNPRTGRELAMERQLLYDFREAPADSMVHMAKEKLRAQIAKQSDRKGGASEGARKRKLAAGFSIPQLDGGADDITRATDGSKEKKLRLMSGSFLQAESNRSKTVAPPRTLAAFASDPMEEVRRRRERILEAYRARAAKLLASKKKQTGNRKLEDAGKKVKMNEKGKPGVDYWVEVFCEHEDKWITIDVLNGSVYNLEDIVKQATQPIAYVLAWNNDGSVKDVSPRYISRFGTIKNKLRIEDEWLERALKPYRGQRTKRDLIEDIKFDRLLNKRPFPEQIAEYRNHPKYAIERFLRRNEAIYPPDAPIVSHIRGEPIYLRSCIYTLQSRDGWLRQAKTVRMHEQPYKEVNARAKYDRVLGTSVTGQTVELFGEWQVEDYVPPVAKDGLVPRTAYGNVDLFKPCMLPKGTVHLQLPGLNRICRRLRIDCAQAITGFEYRSGGCQAVYDGFVVCEEFREQLLDEWYQEQVELERKEQERRRERIYANWRRLIVGLRIRKKLKDRYNFDNM